MRGKYEWFFLTKWEFCDTCKFYSVPLITPRINLKLLFWIFFFLIFLKKFFYLEVPFICIIDYRLMIDWFSFLIEHAKGVGYQVMNSYAQFLVSMLSSILIFWLSRKIYCKQFLLIMSVTFDFMTFFWISKQTILRPCLYLSD